MKVIQNCIGKQLRQIGDNRLIFTISCFIPICTFIFSLIQSLHHKGCKALIHSIGYQHITGLAHKSPTYIFYMMNPGFILSELSTSSYPPQHHFLPHSSSMSPLTQTRISQGCGKKPDYIRILKTYSHSCFTALLPIPCPQ